MPTTPETIESAETPNLFDALHIEILVREWFAGSTVDQGLVDGLIRVLRLRLARATLPSPAVPVPGEVESEMWAALKSVAGVLDAFGNLPDARMCPRAWHSHDAETKLAAAFAVIAKAEARSLKDRETGR